MTPREGPGPQAGLSWFLDLATVVIATSLEGLVANNP